MLFYILKILHLFSIIAWMVGLFYLPRLFAYHCDAKLGSIMDKTFIKMETKLRYIIMLPAVILVFVSGLSLALFGEYYREIWLQIKFLFVLSLLAYHLYLVRLAKYFQKSKNKKSSKFFKIINEITTVLLLIILTLAIVKPL